MAGPTPVSALIHAATMVTAGVYMVCRMSFAFSLAPGAQATVAWTGALTAFFAATIGSAQTDIKKVLAYSTVSQLGYMFLAAGVAAYSSAIFHLMTHAFFKALLFLGAGSVILAMHHEQDITKMGGLRRRMPVTWLTFLIGVIAIAGVPPFSGFFYKDEILLAANQAHGIPGHQTLWLIGMATAFLTAFYMFRLYFLVFTGASRASHHTQEQIHESGNWVLVPLVVLAVFSAIGGFFGLPDAYGELFGVQVEQPAPLPAAGRERARARDRPRDGVPAGRGHDAGRARGNRACDAALLLARGPRPPDRGVDRAALRAGARQVPHRRAL
jgi:NADH-quinone oxidoreductase subunit L